MRYKTHLSLPEHSGVSEIFSLVVTLWIPDKRCAFSGMTVERRLPGCQLAAALITWKH